MRVTLLTRVVGKYTRTKNKKKQRKQVNGRVYIWQRLVTSNTSRWPFALDLHNVESFKSKENNN